MRNNRTNSNNRSGRRGTGRQPRDNQGRYTDYDQDYDVEDYDEDNDEDYDFEGEYDDEDEYYDVYL